MSITNLKNLAYNILKYFEDSIVKDKEVPKLSQCVKCDHEIFLNPLKGITILECGHVFHRICIEKYLLITIPNKCPSPNCDKDVEIFEEFSRRDSTSSGVSSVIARMDKELQVNSTGNSQDNERMDIEYESEDENNTSQTQASTQERSRKRPRGDTSSKKTKTKKGESSMLIKLIEELKTPSSSSNEIAPQSATTPGNFAELYNAIINAEGRIGNVNQEIIKCYFTFGKKLEERLTEYKGTNKERRAQRKLFEEIEKQLPPDLSKNAIEKRIERARKIYDLFSNIGEDKIQRVKSYSALRISKLSWDEIDAIEEEFQ
ncbi:14447_t:CDS:1 [Entrophospora sp. SA101]|nr:14447_t:CDS:1 [Entrophospora sp. SA101]